MPRSIETIAKRAMHADAILAAGVAVIALIVVALAMTVAGEVSLHARTLQTISVSRTIRDDMLAMTQALAEAQSADRDPAARAAALVRAQETAVHIQGVSASSAPLRAEAEIIGALVDEFEAPRRPHLAILQDLNAASVRVQALLNAGNDAARQRENAGRVRLAVLAGVLAALVLAASALAILALRRERAGWRQVRDLAEEARAKATASDLAKSRFLAVASHDMRQPLHALTLYLSALERRVDNPEARDIVQKMERATHSMVGMFATLLDLARVQSGTVSPVIGPFPLQDVLDRIVAHNPSGAVDAPATEAIVRTDEAMLEAAVRNLVSNALRHGGGRARITCTEGADDTIVITVSDEGPGIAPEHHARIFEEFERLDTRAGGEGLGLGLTIVKRVSVLLDLPLTLESAPGEGARFSLRVPRAQQQAPTSEENGAASLEGAAVLVVDDDPLAREAAAAALRALGAEVHTAANEAQAASVLSGAFTPELLVMDLRIDGELAGIAIAQRLRERLTPPPRIIVMTGDTDPDTLEMLRASGFAWLIKPVSPAELGQAAMRAA